MTRKTTGLSFPTNPLASMRELQDLDAIPTRDDPPRVLPEPERPATPLPRSHTTGSEEGSEVTPATGSPGGSEVAKFPSVKRPRPEVIPVEPAPDSIATAVKALLARPYSTGPGKVAVTVSTVKIPSEVWERLDWAAKLTGQTKQDIISDSLKDYFRKVLRER